VAKQPFVPVDHCLRIQVVGGNQNTTWQTGYHALYVGTPPTNADLTTLANQLSTAFFAAWGAILGTNQAITTVRVFDLTNTNSAQGVDETQHTGTAPFAEPLPANAAVCVSWPIQSRYRGGHPRTYMPARNATDIQGGNTLNSTYRNAIQAAAANWRTGIQNTTYGGAGLSMVAVRYFPTGTNPDGTPVLRTSSQVFPIGIPIVHGRLDTMRRRMGRESL
jgi:hypothetical protein